MVSTCQTSILLSRSDIQLSLINTVIMSDAYLGEYDHYNMDENLIHGRSGGKHRTKSESEQNKNHHDKDTQQGHTRKIVNNMQNNKVNNTQKEASSLKH